MKRRDFFEKTVCGAASLMMSCFGLTSCKKEEVQADERPAQAPPQELSAEEMDRKNMVKKLLIEKKGVGEEEADTMITEFEEKLPLVKDMCICKNCPTYTPEETESGFCHPLIGKSKIITEEKGCVCPTCPVYQKMDLKNGYYCTRKSEMEQAMAKMR